MSTALPATTLVMTGAESSGKTTLAQDLAQHFAAPWVPEFARSYLAQSRFIDHPHDYSAADVEAIAAGQRRAEATARAHCAGLLVVDTDLLVILIWMRERFGHVPDWIEDSVRSTAGASIARRYVLTIPEMPWASDPLREHPDARVRLHLLYREALQQHNLRFIEVVGDRKQRLEAVRRWLSET